MTASDLLSALLPVLAALEALGIRHFVGGSVASSVHGVPRASIDADVVAELERRTVPAFVERLRDDYYLDEGMILAAVDSRRSFNLIHFRTAFKVDVFVSKGRPFDAEAQARAHQEWLGVEPDVALVPVASAEDVVLAKLEWYRAGGESSERQWSDVVGVLRTGWAALDRSYLARWGAALHVQDLLQRAEDEARPEPDAGA